MKLFLKRETPPQEKVIILQDKLESYQNSVSHFLFLAANTLSHPRLSLISLRKNTRSNQDL